MDDREFMRLAISTTRAGIAAGQSPFGAVIVRGGALIAAAHNTVWRDCDPTAHAEVNAIRAAALVLKSINLSGCTLYSTCEPCPMCLAASHWAAIDRVAFGATIADAANAGFRELAIPALRMVELGKSALRVEGGLLRDECTALFAAWQATGDPRAY